MVGVVVRPTLCQATQISRGGFSIRGSIIMSSAFSERGNIALNFDVLCDSEPECTRTAWRCAHDLWPDVMTHASDLSDEPWQAGARRAWTGGDWGPLQGDGEDGLPNWLAFKMRQLRPTIESDYEALLLIRLCAEEALTSVRAERGERPLTPGEISANWSYLRESLLVRYCLKKEEAIAATCAARDAWLNEDKESWLRAHCLYPGAREAMNTALASTLDGSLYVTTAKERRFVHELLQSEGLDLDEERIFGLESGSKLKTLLTLKEQHGSDLLSIVEDRCGILALSCSMNRLVRTPASSCTRLSHMLLWRVF